jgi:hypothetical protein
MPLAERQAAIDAASRQDRSNGEWLAAAIRTQLQLEAGELAPTGRDEVVRPNVAQVRPQEAAQALGDLDAVWRFCAAVAQGGGKPMPRDIQRAMWAQVRERLGIAPPPRRGAVRQIVAPVAPSVVVAMPGSPAGHEADQQHGEGEQ